jgi:glucarate dehydratase
MTRARIARVELFRVHVPLRYAYLSSRRLLRHYDKIVIRLSTEDGSEGCGETAAENGVFAHAANLARLVVGADPLDRNRLRATLGTAPDGRAHIDATRGTAAAGIEMACWDLVGKLLDLPLYELLGGAFRDEVPAACELSAVPLPATASDRDIAEFFDDRSNIAHVVQQAERVVRAHGYRYLKLKSRARECAWDIAVMQALHEALGPAVRLRLDPNAGYSLVDGLRLCRELDGLGLQWFEDPVAGIPDMSRLRRQIHTPLATNMCVIDFPHLAPALQSAAVDVVGVDFFHWGGVANARDCATACTALGFGLFGHCYFDLGLTTAANAHLAVASPGMVNGVDTCLYLQEVDVTTGGPPTVRDGLLPFPSGPGLGVTLDRESLRRYTVDSVVLDA